MRTFQTTKNLGKTMPDNLSKEITVEEHSKHFGALIYCDVWTDDGYLVTSVHENGITHQLRQGFDVLVKDLKKDDLLKYNADKRAKEFGF